MFSLLSESPLPLPSQEQTRLGNIAATSWRDDLRLMGGKLFLRTTLLLPYMGGSISGDTISAVIYQKLEESPHTQTSGGRSGISYGQTPSPTRLSGLSTSVVYPDYPWILR